MADATQYKSLVAWRTIANKVVQLTKATTLLLATYRVYVSPTDRHDIGAGTVGVGFYFISYMGNPYLIVGVGAGYIDVEDSFRFRKCPTSGKNGIVYKSVGNGDSPFLSPFFRFLHPNAFEKFMGIALDILWKGSPVVSGLGMDFVPGDPITLGLPSTIDSNSINEVTATSHTHKLGSIDISGISKANGCGALYNFPVTQEARKISSSDDWEVISKAQWEGLLNRVDVYNIIESNWPLASYKLKQAGTIRWDFPNDAIDDFGFSAIGSGERDYGIGDFGGIKSFFTFWLNDEFNLSNAYHAYLENGTTQDIWAYNKKTGKSIRLCNPSTMNPNGYIGTYTQNNGEIISTIVINDVEWTMNLNETKYRNGDWIHGFDGGVYTPISNDDWAALTTEAMCYYNDMVDTGTGLIPLTGILESLQDQINTLQQSGEITNIFSRAISVSFTTPFSQIPVGRSNTYAYRSYVNPEGKITETNVLFWNQVVNTTGFSLEIDADENLSGVIIEFSFLKATQRITTVIPQGAFSDPETGDYLVDPESGDIIVDPEII